MSIGISLFAQMRQSKSVLPPDEIMPFEQGSAKAIKYLSQLPPVPDNICVITEEDEDLFHDAILIVMQGIDDEVERIERQQPTENQITRSVSQKTGISQDKLNRLAENGDEEDGQRLAEQKLEAEYGISPEELENLENMSEAEQKQWAENLARNLSKSAEGKAQQQENRALYNLSARIEELGVEIAGYRNSWAAMQLELIKQDTLATADRNACLEKVRRQAPEPIYQGEHCINQKAIDSYFESNEPPCHQAYCNRITPLRLHTLNTKRADLHKMFVLFDEMQTLRNQMLTMQTGINLNNSQLPEVSALALVKEFANDLYRLF